MATYSVYQDIDQTLSHNFVYDLQAINQSILNLLSTKKGSRIFLAYYGTNIESILFEPCDMFTADLLYKEITDAISLFEPRVILNIGRCTVKADPTYHRFVVTLCYDVIGLSIYQYNYTFGITP